jgi:hypothetical protein
MSDAMAAKSTDTSDERVRNQQRRRLPEQLPRNSGPSALGRLSARFDERRVATRPAGQAMSETADERDGRKPKARTTAGERLAMDELSRRGFEAQLSDRKEHVLLVRAGDSAPKSVRVKTVHLTPWYVRRARFDGSLADQVTVYVLLGLERGVKSARFFVARNRDLAVRFRRSPTSNPIGLIDAKSVEKYENNWDILR